MPAVGQVHIDQALTSLSVMYRNEAYVADLVLSIVASLVPPIFALTCTTFALPVVAL